jgi:HAE1 family hydrophobic/amphiphilic exporter-1
MLTASFIAILLIPMTFYVVERLAHRGKPSKKPATVESGHPYDVPEKEVDHA